MKKEVIEKIAALITAAFGLVAALAWNGAIQAIFTKYYGEASMITFFGGIMTPRSLKMKEKFF